MSRKYCLFLFLLSMMCQSAKSVDRSDYPEKVKCLQAPDSVQIDCVVLNTNSWECIQQNVISVPLNLSKNKDTVLINCTSPHPIDIKISGFQLQDTYETRFVRNAENVFNEATFVYSIGIILETITAPTRFAVTRLNDPLNEMTFFIFRPGNQLFPPNMLSSTPIVVESNPKKLTIPCISSNPHRNLQLSSVNGPTSVVNITENIHYDKTQGFILPGISTIEDTFYRCKESSASSNSSNEELIFKVTPRKEFMIQPALSHIVLFNNDELSLLCRYNRKIQVVGTLNSESILGQTVVDVDFTSTFTRKNMKVGDVGKVDCVEEENQNILHTWTIETLDIYNNPRLQLEKLSNHEVACRSSSADVELKTVYCQGVSNCDLNKGCFMQGSSCPILRKGKACKLSNGNSGSCLTFTEEGYFSQGMIQCSTKNYSYTTKYFRGFDNNLYLDWETAPLNALIDVKVPPPNITMYPHNSYPFGCQASSFISDGKIQWVIRGKDGSEILLHKNRVQDIKSTYNLDYNLHTVRESNIRLIYPNDYDVLCMVPMWNATASLRNHKRINVAAKTAPVKEILIGSGVVIILLIIPLVYVIWRLKKAKEAIRNLTEQEVEEFVKGNPGALQQAELKSKNAHEVIDSIPYNRDFEIPRDKLLIDSENVLGQGTFGVVLKGKVEGLADVVAVKTVKPRCEVAQFKGFLSELKIMMYIGRHPFVVGLIGAHTDKIREKVIYIVVEYCVHGSLENILRNRHFIDQIQDNQINLAITSNNHYQNVQMPENQSGNTMYANIDVLKTVDLLRWSFEIASGMNYLASRKVVHADLAARNVLIHENGTAKITDFGLSRQLFNYTQYESLPWRWMAVESLRSLTFSNQSDVWAYGVTLWEIFSLGDVPYPGLAWTITFVEQLVNGLRMVKPPHATSAIYSIMLNCWHENPASRPTFQILADCFRDILESLNVEIQEPELTSIMTKLPTSFNSEELPKGNVYINELK